MTRSEESCSLSLSLSLSLSAMAANSTAAAICPKTMATTSNGVWQGDHPVDFALPLLILQMCLVLFVTRALALVLTPLKQPRVIAEIIGGVLLGPSALGRNLNFKQKIFPTQSLTLLETVADLGLLFFLFLVGLELDLAAIKKTGKQALSIAAAGISLPFIMGVGVSLVLHRTIASDGNFTPFLVFMGVALSITAFPVLARILAELRLLTTDVGQMAMSAAAVNDVVAWVLLALAVALSGSGKSPLIALWVLLCGVAYVAFLFVAVKPLMAKMSRQVIENEPANEMYVALTLAGVLVSGFITDAIGIHAIFGAFVFGLIIPKDGPYAAMLTEKLEDLVTILMLPLYFAVSGLKTNIGAIHGARAGGLLILVIMTACLGKIVGTFVVAYFSKMGFRKSLALGFLMNTKGLVELIVLNIGKDRKVLNDETFAIMVLMALFTTFITTPVVIGLYKPARRPVPYTRRTLYASGEKVPESELRMLACVHGVPNVHAIMNLVEAMRGMRRRPLYMYILHLLELSERPSAIMQVHRGRRDGRPFYDDQHVNGMDNIVVAFEAFGQLSKVTVRPMTAISHFDDMHEDVCATAEDKRASIIILPFYKYVRHMSDRGWEGHSSGLRQVTQKVLQHAPCSVGILVDRGIGITSRSSSSVDQKIAVLFYGGPDDREALAIGYRMAEHPGVRLTVFRFVSDGDPSEHQITVPHEQTAGGTSMGHGSRFSISSFRHSGSHDKLDTMATDINWDVESKLDEKSLELAKGIEAITNSSDKDMGASSSIKYEERAIEEPLEAAIAVGKMDAWSLVIVGRGRKPSLLILACARRMQTEYPELGPIGGALVAADLSEMSSSVLVVQQYDLSLAKAVPPSSKVLDISTPKSTSLLTRGPIVVTGPVSPSPQMASIT